MQNPKMQAMKSGEHARSPVGGTVTNKTAAYTVTRADNGNTLTNSGASGAVTFTLPTPLGDEVFTFIKATVGQNLVIQAPAGVTINNGTAAQVYKNETSEMGTCTIKAISTTAYAVLAEKGTWANAAS